MCVKPHDQQEACLPCSTIQGQTIKILLLVVATLVWYSEVLSLKGWTNITNHDFT